MTTSPPMDLDLDLALDELRDGALLTVAVACLVGGWLWFLIDAMIAGIATNRDIPAVAMVACMAVLLLVRRHSPVAARWLLLPSLVLVHALTMHYYPHVGLLSFGLIVAIILSPVLGVWQATVGAILSFAIGANTLLTRDIALLRPVLTTFLLYALTIAATFLSAGSLRVAVTWALTGWERARQALDEARIRRGELYRALHALEEATYRIERMNNELVLARTQAEEARALKARFVSTVSHEIRGPLNLILGFSRLMALSPERYPAPLPPQYRADVVAIFRNSQHLASLVDDVLDMSQIEAQRLPLIRERLDIESAVIHEAAHIADPLIRRKGVALHLELTGDLPPLLIDPVRIRQVLLNLLTNAARFTDQGSITVRTALANDAVVVSVRDTGPGIPKAAVSRLFQAFQHIPGPERRADKGSGLGLSISKQLVELHGGEIWVDSAVGAGTTVSFSLPLPGTASADDNGTPNITDNAAPRSSPPLSSRPHVLVIHQDPTIVKTVGRYLEGHQVVGVPQEADVVALIQDLLPRAIITGHDTASRLAPVLADLPFDVPLITCGLPELDHDRGYRGLLGYLVKPVAPELLSSLVGQVAKKEETSILIVDDEPDATRLLESMLQAIPHPYRIQKAYDGEHALQAMSEHIPDLVLVDLLMPRMSGDELIARMRADETLQDVPVVIVSARDWSDEALVVDLPLTVERAEPISVPAAAACIQAMLSSVPPRYVPRADTSPAPASGHLP